MTNEEKARELAHFILYDNSYESMDRNTYDKCMQMAEWKDEQHKQEKQQWIDEACEWLKCNTDMWIGFIDGFKKEMKGK